jgi:hypothetical protein
VTPADAHDVTSTEGEHFQNRASIYAVLSARLHRPHGQGVRAEVRRVRLHPSAPPAAFWDLLEAAGAAVSDDELDFWLDVLPIMTRYPHRPGRNPAHALARAEVGAERVERWLRRRQKQARAELGRVFSKVMPGTELDWTRLGGLLRSWHDLDRRRFAADYFAARAAAKHRTQEN